MHGQSESGGICITGSTRGVGSVCGASAKHRIRYLVGSSFGSNIGSGTTNGAYFLSSNVSVSVKLVRSFVTWSMTRSGTVYSAYEAGSSSDGLTSLGECDLDLDKPLDDQDPSAEKFKVYCALAYGKTSETGRKGISFFC